MARHIAAQFGEEADHVTLLLAAVESGNQDRERVVAAAVLGAHGDVLELGRLVELSQRDWRDVLVAGGLEHGDWPDVLDTWLGPVDHLSRARSLRSVEDAATFYRAWAADYDRDVFERSGVIGSDRIAALLADALPGPDVRVVDLGCGTGAVGVRLAERGVHHVTGLDLSPEMLDVARTKHAYDELVVADLNDELLGVRWRQAFGASVSAGTFTHGHVGATAVPQLLAMLTPGALIAWVVATPLWPAFRDAFDRSGVTVLSAGLEPIRRGADDVAHMVLAQLT